jgi:quercetin dioxygenase-like cupin family protein
MGAKHTLRRVVTGYDAEGKSIIVLDDKPENGREPTEVWATVTNAAEGASEFRVVDMPAGTRREMHRTDTVDYGIVLAGEVHLVLEQAETLLRAGDVVVQRGTSHAWYNRSDHAARMAFVNLSGQITDAGRCPEV